MLFLCRISRFAAAGAGILLLAACGDDRPPPIDSGSPPEIVVNEPDPDPNEDEIPIVWSLDPATNDPTTCAEAAEKLSYLGCEFWPTVTANVVDDTFDFAVVVANPGKETAHVTIERAGELIVSDSVPPNELRTLYLPWVTALKGPLPVGDEVPWKSIIEESGAFHLTSSLPIAAYQFNPLEYAGVGGPPGKDWSTCEELLPGGCFSYTNDASILLPVTTLTTSYRIVAPHADPGSEAAVLAYATLTVTATQDATRVSIELSETASLIGGDSITATSGGSVATFELEHAGDVAQLFAPETADFSGSLLVSDKPVQVVAGIPCVNFPGDVPACDHTEEVVFPAETLGKRYVVTRPLGPTSRVVPHLVTLVGNVDNTQLTYPCARPPKAPDTINAGQVVDLGIVDEDFEVSGDHEFAVGMFMLGAGITDSGATPGTQRGDPAFTLTSAVEQYRTKYVFLAPTDYDVSFVDIVMPLDAIVLVDAKKVDAPRPLGTGEFGIVRWTLSRATGGVHVLLADAPVGIQVMGYGKYTSYHYPGGLDLDPIAPPPPPIISDDPR